MISIENVSKSFVLHNGYKLFMTAIVKSIHFYIISTVETYL